MISQKFSRGFGSSNSICIPAYTSQAILQAHKYFIFCTTVEYVRIPQRFVLPATGTEDLLLNFAQSAMSSTLVRPNLHCGNSNMAMAISNEAILLAFERLNDAHQDTLWFIEIHIPLRNPHFPNREHQQSQYIRCRNRPNQDSPTLNTPYTRCTQDYSERKITLNSCM